MKLTELSFDAMGTHAHVVIGGCAPEHAALALERVRRLEELWSRFIPESEISQINGSPGVAVEVSPETILLVERAVEALRSTRTAGRSAAAAAPTVPRSAGSCGGRVSSSRKVRS